MTITYADGITTITCGDGISEMMCSDPIPFGDSLNGGSRRARARGWEIAEGLVRCPACGDHRRRASKAAIAILADEASSPLRALDGMGNWTTPGVISPGGNRAERRGNPTHPHLRRGQRDNVRNGGEAQ